MGLQEEPQKAYAEQIPQAAGTRCAPASSPSKVNILAGHLFVSGARPGGGERELTIGDIFAITAAALPTTPQYIALGHVHRPQEVPGAPVPTRYAGSLMQLDFGEAEPGKSVTIVESSPGKPAQVGRCRSAPAPADRHHVRLDELEGHAGADDDAYARVFLECEGPSPGLLDACARCCRTQSRCGSSTSARSAERAVRARGPDARRAVRPLLPRARHGATPRRRDQGLQRTARGGHGGAAAEA